MSQKFVVSCSHDLRLRVKILFMSVNVVLLRALTPLVGNWAGAHIIWKISCVLTKIGKFDIVLMYDVFIARLIPIIKLTFFLDIYNVVVSN